MSVVPYLKAWVRLDGTDLESDRSDEIRDEMDPLWRDLTDEQMSYVDGYLRRVDSDVPSERSEAYQELQALFIAADDDGDDFLANDHRLPGHVHRVGYAGDGCDICDEESSRGPGHP